MGQTRSLIAGLALVLGQAATAHAADLGLPLPEPEPCVGCAGPWYLKGFIGAANPRVGGLSYELFTPDFIFYDKDIKSTPLFGLGFGYDTGHYFRFDFTGEYRGRAVFLSHDRYPGSDGTFNHIDIPDPNPEGLFNPGTNEYTADIESWVGLFNTYIDLGTWYCVTPYIGGGIGFASVSVYGYKDVNVPNLGVAYGQDNTQTNFAWAVYGGLAYDVTPSVTLDLAYRYTDLGDAKTGRTFAYDNSTIAGPFVIEDITSHDVMLAVRWKLGRQPAPMPVAFK
jgi:opacity protein-like surface antigen